MRKRLLILLPLALVALGVLFVPLDMFAVTPVTRQFKVQASQFAFDPPTLRVNRGDRVVITLEAVDVVHGLYLDEYDVNVRVEPGLSKQIEFVAEKTGKFRYRCSVSCGSLHPFMIGELVVMPNDTFARAVGLTLVAVLAALVYLWRFPPGEAWSE